METGRIGHKVHEPWEGEDPFKGLKRSMEKKRRREEIKEVVEEVLKEHGLIKKKK